MNILLLGKDGQVGTELRRTLLTLGVLVSVGRNELNLENEAALCAFLVENRPDIIVNAAAYTAVDKAESDADTAFVLNEKVVRVLANYAQRHKTLLVHYSTDYVFDGLKIGPYVETDAVNPQNLYGVSKNAGEQAILQSGCDFLIFRTAWVYSATGNNFIKTIMRLAREKENLSVVSDQYGAPTSAQLIADVTALAIAGYQHQRIPNGIYHLTASGTTTWYQLACYVVEKMWCNGMAPKLNSKQLYPIATEDYPLPAKRPKNSCLSTRLVSQSLGLCIPDWRVDVDRLFEAL